MQRLVIRTLIGLAALLASTVARAETIAGCNATEYGNGVFYLKCPDVGPALAVLRERHPNAVITFTYYHRVAGSNTMVQGYYVIVNQPLSTAKK